MLARPLDLSSIRSNNPSPASGAAGTTRKRRRTWRRRLSMLFRSTGCQILGFVQMTSSAQQTTDDGSWAAPPSGQLTNLTAAPSSDQAATYRAPFIPILVILVLVLASLCAIMGLVYAYIYFTRINSRQKKKTRKAVKMETHIAHHYYKEDEKASNNVGSGGTMPHSTHMFLFKKIHHNNVIK